MDNKVIMGGILLVSTILVMYPIITYYLDLEGSISRYRSVLPEVLRARDDSRSQIIGFSLLFATLFLMLYYVKLEDGMSSIFTAEQTTLPSTPSPSNPLSKKARDSIFGLSVFVFIVVYVWQMGSLWYSTTSPTNPITSIDFMTFLMPILYSLVVSVIVGITGYLMAKIANSSISPMNNESYERRTFIRPETPKKSEEQDWYKQALKQHQIDVTEEPSKQTEDLEHSEHDDELVIETLEKNKDWYAVRHGRKFEWSKSMFRFELLRKLVLTNRRIVFLKDAEIDYEIPLKDVSEAVRDKVGLSGNPYLILELKNGEAFSIIFQCVGVRSLKGIFLLSKQNELTQKWIEAINTQLR